MAKQNAHIPAKPRRPPQSKNGARTSEETQKFQEYIGQLRQWLDSLSDEEHDKALKKLTRRELFYLTTKITYENYQKGGPLRELLEGTCFEGTL